MLVRELANDSDAVLAAARRRCAVSMNRSNPPTVGGGDAKRDASLLVSAAYRVCASAVPTSRCVTIER
jgi:hypothetical protein